MAHKTITDNVCRNGSLMHVPRHWTRSCRYRYWNWSDRIWCGNRPLGFATRLAYQPFTLTKETCRVSPLENHLHKVDQQHSHGGSIVMMQAVLRFRHTSQGRFFRLRCCLALPKLLWMVNLRGGSEAPSAWAISVASILIRRGSPRASIGESEESRVMKEWGE